MVSETLWCIVVALLWGSTNPLMKKGSAGLDKVNQQKSQSGNNSRESSTNTPSTSSSSESSVGSANNSQTGFLSRSFSELKFLFYNWKYTVPFLINQSGSVLYYWTLSSATLSVAVPLTNALTLTITVLVGKLLGEKAGGPLLYLGVALVFLGIAITNS